MSRYPAMPGRELEMRAAYDTTLLTYAPQVSREDRQQGYDIDILERQPVPMSAGFKPTRRGIIDLDNPSTFRPTVVEQDRRSDTYAATSAPLAPLPPLESTPSYNSPPPLVTPYDYGRRVPWWRTKKGMIGLGIGIVIFIGIITGVVAGVVSAQKRNSNRLDDGSSPLNDISAPVITPTATPSAIPSTTPQLDIRPGPPPPPVTSEPIGGDDDADAEPPSRDDDDDDEEEEPVTTTRRRPSPTDDDDDDDRPPRPTVISSTKPAICAQFPNIPACQ